MNIEEAIAYLKTANVDCHPSSRAGEAMKVVIEHYEQATLALAKFGPQLLTEIQEAADWQAVATRLATLLRKRKAPSADAEIEEFLKRLDKPATPPAATPAP